MLDTEQKTEDTKSITKSIYIKISNLTDTDCFNNTVHTYYINFNNKPDGYYYSIQATNEGFGHITSIWKEAGYEIVYKDLNNQ